MSENSPKRQREQVCYLTSRSFKKSKGRVSYQKRNLRTFLVLKDTSFQIKRKRERKGQHNENRTTPTYIIVTFQYSKRENPKSS